MNPNDTLLRCFLFFSEKPVVVFSGNSEFVSSLRRDLGNQVLTERADSHEKPHIVCIDAAPFDIPAREGLRLLRRDAASVVYRSEVGWVEISSAGKGFVLAALLSKLFSLFERGARRFILGARKALLKYASTNIVEVAGGTTRHESGACFVAQLPQFRDYSEASGTTVGHFYLFEESTPLRGHQPHSSIRAEGSGRFSLWNETLFFSSTDGSDPLSNGRRYRAVAWPKNRGLFSAIFDFILIDRAVFEARVADSLISTFCRPAPIVLPVSQQPLRERLLPFLQANDVEQLAWDGVLHVCEQSPDRESSAEIQIAIRAAARRGINCRAYDLSPAAENGLGSSDGALLICRVAETSAGFSFALLRTDSEKAAAKIVHELPDEIRAQVWVAFTHLVTHRPRVLHCWSDESAVTWGLAAVLVGVPQIILTAHETSPATFPEVHRPYFDECFRTLQLSDRVCWVSQSAAASIAYSSAFDIPAEQFRQLPPLVDIERFRPITDVERIGARQTLGLPENSIALGFTSPLSVVHRPQRFVRLLFEARKTNPDIVGVVLGTGPLESYLRAELAALDLAPFCFFSDDALRYETALGALDLAVFSGVEGSRVRPMLEAIASGVPVVARRVAAMDEISFGRDSGVISVSSDFVDLLRTTCLLANDSPRRSALSACARETALELFDIKAQNQAIFTLYAGDILDAETNVKSSRRVANR